MNFVKGNGMKSWMIAVLMSMACLQANAAAVIAAGEVTEVRVDASGNGFVVFSKDLNTPTACGTKQNALSFNVDSVGGRAVYAMVMQAKATGARIWATGTGDCLHYGNTIEAWKYGAIS
ncbi:hypothetical protein V8J88_01190 [Massilia sp. W12]|uniref:hypothetical protein n=1 Tax=Massilia sp. W12 TaxID=3126507 RepID=UPI0030D2210C